MTANEARTLTALYSQDKLNVVAEVVRLIDAQIRHSATMGTDFDQFGCYVRELNDEQVEMIVSEFRSKGFIVEFDSDDGSLYIEWSEP